MVIFHNSINEDGIMKHVDHLDNTHLTHSDITQMNIYVINYTK